MVYDLLFRLGRIRGEWLSGTVIDIGWLWLYAAVGAAALVPSMTRFDTPALAGEQIAANGQAPRSRMGLVATAALMPSAVLFIGSFDTPPWFEPLTVATATRDEFAVLLAGIADERTLDRAAGQLVETLARPVPNGADEVLCTATIGVASTAHDASGADLLRNADIALYAAKTAGKRRWRRYEPWMRSTLTTRLALRTALERAVNHDEFFLEYQPIVALADRLPLGFEALLRWQHPSRGRLAPDQFIDVAEDTGLITPIGEWVLATCFGEARSWPATDGVQPHVGVNVSARQFRSRGLVPLMLDLVRSSGVSPNRLTLEITESLLLREDDSVWADLHRIREAGIKVAIDDFGTGYSALSYLRQVPLNVVIPEGAGACQARRPDCL
jgi:predicted signal transduction protein with EAL and GGDEF domain